MGVFGGSTVVEVGWVEGVEGRGSGKYAFYGRNNRGSMSPEIYRLGDIVSTNFFHVISRLAQFTCFMV